MVIQVSGFDDKVNVLGLVIETIEPPPAPGLIYFIISSPFGGGGGRLNREGGPI